jgi:outer membrane protein assembly factor BamB
MGEDGGSLTALDPATGEPAWAGPVLVPGSAGRIHALEGAVVAVGAGSPNPVLRVFRAADGRPLPFFVPLRRGDERPGELLPLRRGPLVIRKESSLEAHDPAKGTRLWAWPAPARIHSAAAAGGVIAVLDGDPKRGDLHGIEIATGREAWTAAAGKGRRFDPLSTTLCGDGAVIYDVNVDAGSGGGLVLEARGSADGILRWSAPLSRTPALVEILPSGAAVLAKYFGAGSGRTGTAVFEAATGREIDRFEDPDGRLGADGFDGAAISGVLVLANERIVLARGK